MLKVGGTLEKLSMCFHFYWMGEKYSLVSSNMTLASNHTGTGELPLGLMSNGKKVALLPKYDEETLIYQPPKAKYFVTGFSVCRCFVPKL